MISISSSAWKSEKDYVKRRLLLIWHFSCVWCDPLSDFDPFVCQIDSFFWHLAQRTLVVAHGCGWCDKMRAHVVRVAFRGSWRCEEVDCGKMDSPFRVFILQLFSQNRPLFAALIVTGHMNKWNKNTFFCRMPEVTLLPWNTWGSCVLACTSNPNEITLNEIIPSIAQSCLASSYLNKLKNLSCDHIQLILHVT